MAVSITNVDIKNGTIIVTCSEALTAETIVLARRPIGEQDRFYISSYLPSSVNDKDYSFDIKRLIANPTVDSISTFDVVLMNKADTKFNNVNFQKPDSLNKSSTEVFASKDVKISFGTKLDDKNRVSLIMNVEQLAHYSAKVEEGKIVFSDETDLNECSLYIAKRENKAHNNVYDYYFQLDIKDLLIENIYRLIKKYVKGPNEIWDFLIKKDDVVLPVECLEAFDDEYKTISPAFDGKLFVSEKKYLSVYTKEGENKNRNKVKVAIIGTCYTKQAFHSIDYMNPDYKRFYENECIIFHTTFESMMANPIEVDDADLHSSNEEFEMLLELYGRQEFDKDAIKKLCDYNPDYIVIDLFTESRNSLYKVGESYVSDMFFFKDSVIETKLKKSEFIKPIDERRLPLFEVAVKKFRDEISAFFPLENIILVRSRSATKYYDKQNALKSFDDVKCITNPNKLWDVYDSKFLEIIPEARVIDMRKYDFPASENSPLVLSPNHFVSNYYRTLLNEFNKLTLLDLIKENL